MSSLTHVHTYRLFPSGTVLPSFLAYFLLPILAQCPLSLGSFPSGSKGRLHYLSLVLLSFLVTPTWQQLMQSQMYCNPVMLWISLIACACSVMTVCLLQVIAQQCSTVLASKVTLTSCVVSWIFFEWKTSLSVYGQNFTCGIEKKLTYVFQAYRVAAETGE